MSKLTSVVVEHNPSAQPITHSVIWLHGLGASGHDFEPIVPNLSLAKDAAVRFIFPHAPKIPITINNSYVMPAWYDILEMSLNRKVDVAQIMSSSAMIDEIIDDEIAKGIDSQNIIIAGFSQGGAVAYHNVLTNSRKLGGLLALSTYFATFEHIQSIAVNHHIAVKIDHGEFDDIVPKTLGIQAMHHLKSLGLNPIYTTYPMAHQVCLPQITSIGDWLNALIKS